MQFRVLWFILAFHSCNAEDSTFVALADHLIHDDCYLHLVSLDHEQILKISNLISKPVVILNDYKQDLVNEPRSHCKTIVTNYKIILNDRKILRLRKLALKLFLISSEDDKVSLEFQQNKNPVFTLQSINDGMVILYLSCSRASKTEITNIWKDDLGWINPDPNTCKSALVGQQLNVSTQGLAPYIITNGDSLSGIDIDILKIMSQRLGFSYSINLEKVWGAEIGNSGAWSGVIGKVMNESSQLGLGNIIIQEDRSKVIDYLQAIHPMDMQLVSSKPKQHMSSWNVFRPFSVTVWVGVLLSLAVATVVLTSMTLLDSAVESQRLNRITLFFSAYAILIQQHFDLKSERLSLRIGYGMWHICIFFFVASYACNLRSYLMHVEYEKPVDSDADIVNLNRRLFIASGTPFINLYKNSPIKVQKEIFKTARIFFYENGNIPMSIEAEIMKHGDAQITVGEQALASFALAEKRYGYLPFRIGKDVIFHFHAAFLVPKNSYFKDEVNNILSKLIDGGIVDKLRSEYLPAKYMKEESQDMSPVAFQLSHIIGAMILLSSGLFWSTMLFVAEHAGRKISRNNKLL